MTAIFFVTAPGVGSLSGMPLCRMPLAGIGMRSGVLLA
jgi:hypothetical protein